MIRNKKGFVYFVEIALAVLILAFVFSAFIGSEQRIFQHKQLENLRAQGWGALDVLHELGALDSAVSSGNFTKVDLYVSSSLFETTGYDLEVYNSTGCTPIDDGQLGVTSEFCDSIDAPTQNDVVSLVYTPPTNLTTTSLRLYLWSKL